MATSLGVVIGRFQPFHNNHLKLMQKALDENDRCVIVLGSADSERTVNNPFTVTERKKMVIESVVLFTRRYILIDAVADFHDDVVWACEVNTIIARYTCAHETVYLYGGDDANYLNLLAGAAQRSQFDAGCYKHATPIRNRLFNHEPVLGWGDKKRVVTNPPPLNWLYELVPFSTFRFIGEFVKTEEYAELCKAWRSANESLSIN